MNFHELPGIFLGAENDPKQLRGLLQGGLNPGLNPQLPKVPEGPRRAGDFEALGPSAASTGLPYRRIGVPGGPAAEAGQGKLEAAAQNGKAATHGRRKVRAQKLDSARLNLPFSC